VRGAERDAAAVADTTAVTELDAVDDAPTESECDDDEDGVTDGEPVTEPVTLGDDDVCGELVTDADSAGVLDADGDTLARPDVEPERVDDAAACGVREAEADAVETVEADDDAATVALADTHAVTDGDLDITADAVPNDCVEEEEADAQAEPT